MTKAASLESLVSQLLKTAETIEVAARALEAALAPSVGAVVAVGEALYPLLNRPKEGPLGPLREWEGGLPSLELEFPLGEGPLSAELWVEKGRGPLLFRSALTVHVKKRRRLVKLGGTKRKDGGVEAEEVYVDRPSEPEEAPSFVRGAAAFLALTKDLEGVLREAALAALAKRYAPLLAARQEEAWKALEALAVLEGAAEI